MANSVRSTSIIDETSLISLRKDKIAAFFRDHRQTSGLSTEAVASALGLDDPAQLLRYESGEEPIPMDEIFSLTNLLNIPPEEVLKLIFDTYYQGQD